MKIIDAYILAATKRKTRRIRTALVVIMGSLLFALLFFAAFAIKGVQNAGDQLKDVGFNGRNIVLVAPTGNSGVDFNTVTTKIHAEMDAELTARKVKVTDTVRQDPSYIAEFGRRMTVVTEQFDQQQEQKLEKSAQQLGHASALYHFQALDISNLAVYQPTSTDDPYVDTLMQQIQTGQSNSTNQDQYSNQLQFSSVETGMINNQLQPGQSFAWQPGQPYPMVISYAYLEKLSGQSFAKVDASERNAAYRKLMSTYAGKVLTYCYRNSQAQLNLQSVLAYNYKAASDSDKTTNPINVPVCGGFDQKQLKKLGIIVDASADAPKPLFTAPADPDPLIKNIQFKIVGFIPSVSQYSGGDVVANLLTSVASLPTNPQAAIVPANVVAAEPLLSSSNNTSPSYGFGYTYVNLYADFKTRAEEKAFIAKGCTGNECNGQNNTRPYVQPFGSISFAMEGVFHNLSKFVLIGVLGVVIIAAVLMLFTISKVIADSIKEIAVFRSLGARRRDIAQIYYTYGFMLALASLVLAIAFAIIGSMVATHLYQVRITNALVQAVGAYNTDMHVSLLGVQWLWDAAIAVALGAAAFLGISVPVLASIRRKLVTILREE